MTYLLAFTLSTCVIVHTVLYHGRSLLNGFKKIQIEQDDIHAKLMKNYPEVPDWWYGLSIMLFFGLAITAVEVIFFVRIPPPGFTNEGMSERSGTRGFLCTHFYSLCYFQPYTPCQEASYSR